MRNLVLMATLCLGFVSCAHIRTKTNTYTTKSPVTINGAKITTELLPQGGSSGFSLSAMVYSAGSAKLKGPFKWRILATGTPDQHTSLTIHALKVSTALTKRTNTFPILNLPPDATFLPYSKTPGITYAAAQFPGLLEIDPPKDGTTTMTVDLTVRTLTSKQRKTVTFTLVEQNENKTDFLFIPSELAKSFGPRDPREWQYTNSD